MTAIIQKREKIEKVFPNFTNVLDICCNIINILSTQSIITYINMFYFISFLINYNTSWRSLFKYLIKNIFKKRESLGEQTTI